MKQLIIIFLFFSITGVQGNCQPPGGYTANENEYEKDHIKKKSEKSHKETDKINRHNTKVQEHSNKKAEQERKDKLKGKNNTKDNHQFPH